MLCQHPGKSLLRRRVLQSSRSLERTQPVRIVPGVFFGFLLQDVSTAPHLLVKYGIDLILCDSNHFLPDICAQKNEDN